MNPVRKWIRDIFGFSGNEINGFLILLPLMMLLIFSEPLYHTWMATRPRSYPQDIEAMDSLLARWPPAKTSPGQAPVIQEVSMFEFDPNTASVQELRRLGFPENLANRIAAYRSKGGGFAVKSDLLKIYQLDSSLYKRLYSYIRLPSRRLKQDKRPGTATFGKKDVNKSFDINTADTILLKSVYGIGPVLAARIVRFRDALGGFVRTEQLHEVYGLDSAVVRKLLMVGFIHPDFVPAKININSADEKKLSAHPYIRKKIAGALIHYRFQHGDFADINDIKRLSLIGANEAERLLPYLKITD